MKTLFSIILTISVSFLSLFGFYNYLPVSILQPEKIQTEKTLGTSITTINGSDTLKNSRTTINDNFTALNAGKIENSTTTLPLLTTLANLTTVGTLTSGALGSGFTVVPVSLWGTGTSSPMANYVMLGNGSSGLKVVNGLGTSGQFLTSAGAGAPPTWTTSAIDTAGTYDWTGQHGFNNLTNFIATSTMATTTVNYLKVNKFALVAASSTTYSLVANPETEVTVLATTTIPANTLGSTGVIRAKAFTYHTDMNTGATTTITAKYGSGSASVEFNDSAGGGAKKYIVEVLVIGNQATNSQLIIISATIANNNAVSTYTAYSPTTYNQATVSVDSTADQYFLITQKHSLAGGGAHGGYGGYVEILK